jgi:thiosulfate/3-mercaptopyruvate sulfurtransferase
MEIMVILNMEKINEKSGKAHVKNVSTDWVEDHLKDENIILVDTQPDIHDYLSEHLPTAVYLNENVLRITKHGLPSTYASNDVIQSIFRRIGLVSGSTVVVYSGKGTFKGWGDGLQQTMLAYTLARFGHDDIAILDGGIDQWKQEQKPVSQVFPRFGNSNFYVKPREEYIVTMDDVKNIKDQNDVLLLDARPANFYDGTSGPWIRNGHIPGALNVPWKLFMDEANPYLLKPKDQINSIVDDFEITKDKSIICSCGTGREATAEFVLLKWLLNYPKVKLYEGSYTEWSAYPTNPIESRNPVSPEQRIM